MKKFILIALVAFFSYGCAERRHIMSTSKTSKSEIKSVDSTGKQISQLRDKSVTTIERNADTSATFTGKPITGELDTRLTGDDGTISQHFENEDIDLDLSYNKNTGKASAKATPKTKQVNFNYHEKKTVQNDIRKIDNSKYNLKSNTELKSDTTSKQVNNHTDPAKAISNLRTVAIWILGLIVALAVILIICKKYFKIF